MRKLIMFALLWVGFAAQSAWAISALSFFPASGATTACADSKLQINFDTTPTLGTSGQIRIYRADTTLLKTIDITNNVTTKTVGATNMNYYKALIVGKTAWIDPGNTFFSYNTSYYIQVDSTVFPGYAGIGDTTTWAFTTKTTAPTLSTNITVRADGTGDFATWQGAVDLIPAANGTFRTINIGAGNYVEQVNDANKTKVTFQGADRATTILQYPNNNTFQNQNGITASTDNRILFEVAADDTTIRDVTIWNTTPVNGSQAEAIRVKQSNRVILRDANFKSYQDTMQLDFRVYCYNLYVEGDVDYIWGSGGGVYFDKCTFKSLRNGYLNQARNNSGPAIIPGGPWGYIFVDCNLLAAPGVTSVYFNRIDPSAFPFSNVAMVNCSMDPAYIVPAGWLLNTVLTAPSASFWEYQSVDQLGKPIDTSSRLSYSRQLSASEAAYLRIPKNVVGGGDNWNPSITRAFETTPLGYASVNDLSQNGTNGGNAGTTVTATNQTQLDNYCSSTTALVIKVAGTITLSPVGHMVSVASNKTILGTGTNPQVLGGGFSLDTVQNVIIKNLTVKDSYVTGDFEGLTADNDCVLVKNTHHVWIDHCLFTRANSGLVDITNNSDYVTLSWSVLSYQNKSNTFGQGSPQAERITVHHCWFLNTNQGSTFNDNAIVHEFDNYFTGVATQAGNSPASTQLMLENNYYKQTTTPHIATGGSIQAAGNVYYNTTGSADSNVTNITVPYSYTLDPAGNVPVIVQTGAGPNGGASYTDNLLKTVKVAFRPTGNTAAYGYLEDNGATSGTHSLFQYGWDVDNSASAFWRTNNNPISSDVVPTETDRRQNGGITLGARTWEIGLAKGTYGVNVNAGDPNGPPFGVVSANNTILLETTNTLTDLDGADQFDNFQTTVTVTDGRLSVKQDAGGSNARINYIEITPLSLVTPTPTPTPTPTVKTVSKGGVAADITTGATGLTTALASAADGSEYDIIESGDYPVTAAFNILGSATRAHVTIKALVANVRFVSAGSATCTIGASGGPFTVTLDSVQFIGTGTNHGMVINQNASLANGTTITMTNCHVEQTNTAAALSGIIINGAAGTGNLVDATNSSTGGCTITLVATNSVFRSKNNNQRAAIDLRGTNLTNMRMNLTGCQLYNDNTPGAFSSNGALCLDSLAAYYYHLNFTNCSFYNTSPGRAAIFQGSSGTARMARSELNFTSCSFTSTLNKAISISPTASDAANNVGDIRVTMNRCLFDNRNVTRQVGTINGTTYPNYTFAAASFNFTNASGPMVNSPIKITNCLILGPQDDPALPAGNQGNTGARGITMAGTMTLTAYGNTFVAMDAIGNAGIGAGNSTPTYVAKNNIFYNYKAPISGSTSSATQQSTAAALIGGATNTNNLIVGPYDDTEGGASRIWHTNIFDVLGTDFRPLSGSAAKDAGDTDSAITAAGGSLDFEGVSRDASPNIGAFETTSAVAALPVELSNFTAE